MKAWQDGWVAVALVEGGVGGEEVEIFFAVDVPDPAARGTLDDDVEGVIVVGAVLVFESDEIGRLGGRLLEDDLRDGF